MAPFRVRITRALLLTWLALCVMQAFGGPAPIWVDAWNPIASLFPNP